MGKVRIVNNGQPGWMTQVTNAETGKPIPAVRHIDISLGVQGVPTATIFTHILPEIDVTVEGVIENTCPCCGRSVPVLNTPEVAETPAGE
jgi:hypothetical protein